MKSVINPWVVTLAFFGMGMAALANPYLEAGLAATDREWRGSDYAAVAEAIKTQKVPLPRLTDHDGQKILSRFCATDNLAFNRSKSLPISSRMQDYTAILTSGGAVINLYAAEVVKGVKLNDEFTVLMVFQMELSVLGIELVDEFFPTLQKDEKYETRMRGLQKMRSGMTTVFVGMQHSIAEDDILSSANKSDLLKVMAKTAASFATVFSGEVKAELRVKFQSMKSVLTSEADIASINTILKAISN